ncbi:AAA family ATPase [Ornithinimicrobium sp. Y1694]|uniref:AAA family ATPase n=1 Tax=Ornithinimicrobium sp. Y1694 TaxID=3418590 RepID=UPI003CEA3C12
MTTQSLRETVDVLARIGREAGLDEGTVRAEGEALAAAVMEQSNGASELARAWGSAFNHPASDFFGMVPRGRRFSSIPTTSLQTLLADASPHARGYAEALAEIATTAAAQHGVGAVSVGRATAMASTQLRAAGVSPSHGPSSPTGGLTAPQQPSSGLSTEGSRLSLDPAALQSFSSDLLQRAQQQSERMRQMLGHLGQQDPSHTQGDPSHTQGEPSHTQGEPGQQPGEAAYPDPVATQPPPEGTEEPEEHEPAEPEKSLEELLAELDELIGLERVKAEIHRQVAVLKMDARRQEAGLRVVTLTRHLVFVGNPGTGKTTVARLVGGIYKALGLLSKGQLVEVDRSELVAGYLGQTAAKTAEVVDSAKGGVLFIDEAYSLSGDQYGKEAVDTLVKEMEDHRDNLVVIVAGYPEPMAEFIGLNPGLESRFRTIIEFDDYSDDELVGIQEVLAARMDYDISEDATERFKEILAATPRGPSFGNGRFSRNMLEAAIGRHAWRLRDEKDATVEQLRTLERVDFEDRDAVDLSVEHDDSSDEPSDDSEGQRDES